MAKINNKAFTLVELLAVIVILAVILVIAVPSIMSTITESRKGALASSAKLIASSAETAYISNQTLGITDEIRCEDVSNYTEEDYKSCDITFVDGKAKVTLVGQGKFEGMAVCGGTKEEALVKMKNSCPAAPLSFSTDSWETISEAAKDGNTSKYNVGDTKTVNLGTSLGTHTVRIANKTSCSEVNVTSQTACGFVIEFADIITTHAMNSNNTNVGGWPKSAMYSYLNVVPGKEGSGTIYNALVSAIGDIIIDTTVVSGHGYGDTKGELANNNFGSTDKVYLLSTREVWGTELGNDTAGGNTITRQLDYYATYDNKNGTIGVTTSKYAGAKKQNGDEAAYWWLRSAFSSSTDAFYTVIDSGSYTLTSATGTAFGVSPAFRLG